ncbi:MAG TPA: ABC transporter permease [Candidatus Didemnitutus sp.]|nr:ABC transporter permease [Candidatus Didemnitutus sp.]
MKFALRSLLKSPGFTVVALVTLALGIGVNTSMFSLVESLLLRPAPFPEGRRMFQVIADTHQGPRYSYSEVETREIREKATSFESLTTLRYLDNALAEPGRPAEQVLAVMASAEFFSTFRVQPILGRAFTAAETEPGRNQVVVLSHAFWQRRFGGSTDIIGRTLRVDGESVTVIGVMPASFDWRFLWGQTAFWRPLNYTPDQLKRRDYRAFQMIGRLKPGVTGVQAMAELGPVAAAQLKDSPQDYDGLVYHPKVLHEAQMDNDSRRIVLMLLGLSGFVLLIACANLANLQLARATTAMRDFAIRAALGASRAQLVRQQLTECVILSLAGGGLGVMLAWWLNHVLNSIVHIANEPGGLGLELNVLVLIVNFAVAALTGVIFGIVPAWLSSRTDVVTSLKSQSRGSTSGRGQHRMRQALIIAEVALALVLLGGAGVMQRGFDKFLHKNLGWDSNRVLSGALPMPEARFPTPESRLAFFRQIQTRLAALPGVEKVAMATDIPLWGFGNARKVFTEKMPSGDQSNLPLANHVMITSDYFKVLGIPLVEGREFSSDIKPDDPKVILVNESLAKQMWPGRSAVGQRLATINGKDTVWSEVIGVVRDAESAGNLGNEPVKGVVFRSVVHEPWTWIRFVIRARNPGALVDSARKAVAEVDPDLPADQLMTVQAAATQSTQNLVVVAQLLAGFALLGLILAAVGLYGVISNLVAQRTSEFGIRLALGARPFDVLTLVLRHGITLTLIGMVLGLGGAYGLSNFLHAILPRLVNPDAVAIGGMAGLLFLVAVLACWIPARRATRVDPMVALRSE